MNAIQTKLIKAGVRNLQSFGYQHVNESNILTDIIYSGFFVNMLNENKGHGVDREINELIEIIKAKGETP